eukprot:maker-scaffold135_size322082-snap-gene-0.17 protein:Tk07966 transcript:maker-scaffold135_size322082-snap-gene-0.17-mRNA-1 annotation:"hypothetical protein LOTGIDRAFT_159033"
MSNYYVRHSTLPLEEDTTVEFKGHRSVSIEEINPDHVSGNSRRGSRQHISKYLCGMLNTGQGGTMYLGVLDSGVVEGFSMSVFQKDHFRLSLRSTLVRFTPPVARHSIQVSFIPVIEDFDHPQTTLEKISTFEGFTLKRQSIDRNMEHAFRVKFCWCDQEAAAAFNLGRLNPFFVIEIKIPPWNGEDSLNHEAYGRTDKTALVTPIFLAEDGVAYLRNTSSTSSHTVEEIAELSRKSSNFKKNPLPT